MEMRAYDSSYLEDAMENFAYMVDFAVNVCGESLREFLEAYVVTPISVSFGKGNPKYVAGMSGTELAYAVFDEAGKQIGDIEVTPRFERSPEYWCGWVLAYYQWYTGKSFEEILRTVPAEEILEMYPALHEADITKFADIMDKKMKERNPRTKLKRLRECAGLSQAELSEKSGVSLRSIQMYEQRNKDINRAQAASVAKLARTLGCSVEDLIE